MPDIFDSTSVSRKTGRLDSSEYDRSTTPDFTIEKSNNTGVDGSQDQSGSHLTREKIHHKHRLGYRSVDNQNSNPHRNIDEYSELMKGERPVLSPLASYVPKPFQVKFSTQAPNENVILLLRQHPVTQLGWIIIAIVAALVPLLFDITSFFDFLTTSLQIGIYLGWYLVLFGFILESFIKWFYNVYIITDERIIDLDFFSLTYRNISAAKIDNIEDTTAQTAGFLSALFDYGTVNIQTAAEKREFDFEGVPHPTRVTTLINDLILEEEREKIEGRVI